MCFTEKCNQRYECTDKSDELHCSCKENYFQCQCYKNNPVDCKRRSLAAPVFTGCIPFENVNDGIAQCPDKSDENFQIKKQTDCNGCNVNITRLTNTTECNLISCNISTCYNVSSLLCSTVGCNETDLICMSNCPADSSKQCNTVFQCDDGCLGLAFQFCDGTPDCRDKSDEIQYQYGFKCVGVSSGRKCVLPQRNLHDNVAQCNDESDLCKNNSCFQCFDQRLLISTNQVCDGLFDCYDLSDERFCQNDLDQNSSKNLKRNFRCDDNSLGFTYQMCNDVYDCPDGSDEIKYLHGFKCIIFGSDRKCVLPQQNLHDDVAQCSDESDLCENNSCFQCFDRRLLISTTQVCDGWFDCYDWSDECLCEQHFNSILCNHRFPVCSLYFANSESKHNYTLSSNFEYKDIINVNAKSTKSKKICQTRIEDHFPATLCDGRPECSDLSDECDCKNPPKFCNLSCHTNYNIGDRYCDGIEDNFYGITNKPDCSKGFEEKDCPKRFFCKAGNKLSIDINQKCDGKQDCDNNADEEDCKNTKINLFSSNLEMIASPVLKSCFWIMGIAVICGNFYVIISTTKLLKTAKLNKTSKYQQVLILNISIADSIMGIYLLTIAVYSAYYSGYYGQVDFEWRSSLRCSIIGSFAVLSSEASCFLLVLLTSSRLYAIYKPFSTLSTSTRKYKLAIITVWLISVIIAVLPIPYQTSEYFVHGVQFSNRFSRFPIWTKKNITKFACRFAKLSNKTMETNSNVWEFTKSFLKANTPEYSPGFEFGYYGQTSVCMPRFFVKRGEHAWEYSLAIITVNFLCFFFIAISYICIFRKSTKNKFKTNNNKKEKQKSTMQRRISRIIITDFLCWIPICIIAFVKLSGFSVDDVAYIVSAGLLLPINSAFNPILYSSLPDKLIRILKKLKTNWGIDKKCFYK